MSATALLEPTADGAGALTAREREVLGLAELGLAPKLIARRLELSHRTVHKHLQNAYAKLGVPNLLAALAAVRGVHVDPWRA